MKNHINYELEINIINKRFINDIQDFEVTKNLDEFIDLNK